MNLQAFKEFNRFKELVSSKKQAGWQNQIEAFKEIKTAESLPVDECVIFGKYFVLCGIIEGSDTRPVVYDQSENMEYPRPAKLAFFPQIDLFQDLIDLQDEIDVVSDLKDALGMVEKPFMRKITQLFNISVVYGKAIKKGARLQPHLTLAEVISQLGLQFLAVDRMLFYVCDTAEECGDLTTYAGYHAYRVAVYKIESLPDDVLPELSIDGYTFE